MRYDQYVNYELSVESTAYFQIGELMFLTSLVFDLSIGLNNLCESTIHK
jgi:hypothetical protein